MVNAVGVAGALPTRPLASSSTATVLRRASVHRAAREPTIYSLRSVILVISDRINALKTAHTSMYQCVYVKCFTHPSNFPRIDIYIYIYARCFPSQFEYLQERPEKKFLKVVFWSPQKNMMINFSLFLQQFPKSGSINTFVCSIGNDSIGVLKLSLFLARNEVRV
jgi:hypothetical protein